MKYTKGEWIVTGDGLGYSIICDQTNPDDTVDIADVAWSDKCKANAHLISAAPDMYEALKALVEHFRNNDENYYKSDLCTDAISALAKAEGK